MKKPHTCFSLVVLYWFMDALIRTAIAELRLIEFWYDDYLRVVEAHVYGIKNDKYQILAFQVGGQSRKQLDLPNWRRFNVDQMVGIWLLDEHFDGRRDYSPLRDSHFDAILVAVP